ncbi:putative SCAR/WAVE family protein [Helianthus debilis subsp. tardiflorus]
MPFSRYQIRKEFSLGDPTLLKAGARDDPEALLEGVAMAGLVGVLRQLGDLAEFAAEVFHGLHEQVMVTASRGHGLSTRVQQIESDFRSFETTYLSQTRPSAFFTRSGIRWHPNLQTEQNIITKGDIPRFVMDSYEECRGPPQLFLLDKFDVAGAGACLKRYTDPSIYKVEAPSYEMMKAETQRGKKIRKAKKKGSRWKNGHTPEVFQPSHVKLHQLLLEERVQNGASNPARRAKLKKRETKIPFDTETSKGYMMTLLSSSPEDKLVHEVKTVNSPLRLPTDRSEETFEVKMVNSPLDDNEEKHISLHGEHKNVIEDDKQSDDDVASETENYKDALATMESEVETDADSVTTSPNNMSPRGNDSPRPFASTEIPFRPRVQISDNCIGDKIDICEDETELRDAETASVDSESQSANVSVCDPDDSKSDDINDLATVDNPSVISRESYSIPSVSYDLSSIQNLDGISTRATCNGRNEKGGAENENQYANLEILKDETVFVTEKADQNGLLLHVSPDVDLSQLLPKLAPINVEEMPPLPPLPPMEWRVGKLQMPPLPPDVHRVEPHQSLNQNEIAANKNSECDHQVNAVEPKEQMVSQPPFDSVESQNVSTSGPDITRLSSTSSLPSGDDELRNDIQSMKVQRACTPPIDAVAPYDKVKLRKVPERATPLFPKEEERDTFLEQIRAKSSNLKPAIKSRPVVIPGPMTNLRVAAILEKANAIRQAFAGSDDEDDNDSWSDS